jgi:hypothetical protein
VAGQFFQLLSDFAIEIVEAHAHARTAAEGGGGRAGGGGGGEAGGSAGGSATGGTQFTCFTGTKVQVLTPAERRVGGGGAQEAWQLGGVSRCCMGRVCWRRQRRSWRSCRITSAKVHMLLY